MEKKVATYEKVVISLCSQNEQQRQDLKPVLTKVGILFIAVWTELLAEKSLDDQTYLNCSTWS